MHSKPWRLAATATLAISISAIGLARSIPATQAAAGPAGPVLSTPVTGTPHLLANANGSDQIRQIVQCGNTLYAVGTFSQIQQRSTVYSRSNAFSFSATKPYAVTSWTPAVNGIVNSITFNGANCADAYLGGRFTAIGGTTVSNIAEVDTTSGKVVTTFGHSASSKVETLASYHDHIIVGGYYTTINGSSADRYLTSLNPVTGKDDGFIRLSVSGNYQFPGVTGNATHIYNQSFSHSGTLDLIMGDFTSVGGLPRRQIFMLNLATTPASVTGWTSPQWDGSKGYPPHGYYYDCWTSEPYYLRAATWSPDDSTIFLGTTGYRPWNYPASLPQGLCDAAAAFPSTQATVLSKWINYTGCDSLYSTAADTAAAYFGGHERWSENPDGCDAQGPGGIVAPGMEGLVPSTGSLLLNQQGTALYTRDRGLGADDMLLTSAGLWIASDNADGSRRCGGVYGLAGLCFLPYPGA